MPGWAVTLLLAAVVTVIVLVFGNSKEVTIFAVVFAWFAILGAIALAIETAIQYVSRLFRRR